MRRVLIFSALLTLVSVSVRAEQPSTLTAIRELGFSISLAGRCLETPYAIPSARLALAELGQRTLDAGSVEAAISDGEKRAEVADIDSAMCFKAQNDLNHFVDDADLTSSLRATLSYQAARVAGVVGLMMACGKERREDPVLRFTTLTVLGRQFTEQTRVELSTYYDANQAVGLHEAVDADKCQHAQLLRAVFEVEFAERAKRLMRLHPDFRPVLPDTLDPPARLPRR